MEVVPMDQEKEEVLAFAREAKAPNTKRAYQADWNDFAAFCRSRNNVSLPADPDVVAMYLRHEAEKVKLKMTTVARRIAANAGRTRFCPRHDSQRALHLSGHHSRNVRSAVAVWI